MPNRDQTISIDVQGAAFAREALLAWFRGSAREFPWRQSRSPYRVLISEMMLRRTQARQVPDVYERFIQKYPDPVALDQASESEVSTMLYSLGLKWRAANFKALAHDLVEHHQGNIPEDRKALLALPGVGPYVADAVRCFAFGHTVTLADTNTVRVAARYFGFEYTPESRRRQAVVKAISHLITDQAPASSNYALLDFAALVCQARSPRHENCPLVSKCGYYLRQKVAAGQDGLKK